MAIYELNSFQQESSIDAIFNLIMTLRLRKLSVLWFLLPSELWREVRLIVVLSWQETSPIMIFNCKHCSHK